MKQGFVLFLFNNSLVKPYGSWKVTLIQFNGPRPVHCWRFGCKSVPGDLSRCSIRVITDFGLALTKKSFDIEEKSFLVPFHFLSFSKPFEFEDVYEDILFFPPSNHQYPISKSNKFLQLNDAHWTTFILFCKLFTTRLKCLF